MSSEESKTQHKYLKMIDKLIKDTTSARKKSEAQSKKDNANLPSNEHVIEPNNLGGIALYLHKHHEPLRKFGLISGICAQERLIKRVRSILYQYLHEGMHSDLLDDAACVLQQASDLDYGDLDEVYYRFQINEDNDKPPMSDIDFELIDHLKRIRKRIE